MSSASFESSVLSIERTGHVATLWLDRADGLNAMGPTFFDDLPRAMAHLDADTEIRAIVIAARGRHFTAGLDLVAMGPLLMGAGEPAPSRDRSSTEPEAGLMKNITMLQAAISSVAEIDTPTIAAVHGACIGGGVDLIAACDLRFASRESTFSIRETKMAIVADLGSLQRLQRLLGHGLVNELALTGKDIDAERAQQIGLVNALGADSAAALALAHACAQEIAENSPLVVRGTKRVLRESDHRSVQEGLAFVAQWNALYLRSKDLDEAISAFLEKRSPRFEGR